MAQNFNINKIHCSESCDERIKFIILHYTAQNFETSLALLKQQVSAHYLINDNPVEIFRLVDEEKRAWHAGVSSWEGRNNLNDSSIGIEIVNLDGNCNPYSDEQIDAVMFLCQQIIAKYNIAPNHILAHSDIAPLRKQDPGSLFPWKKLYENGIGAMVDEADILELEKPTALELQQNLAKYGYGIELTGNFDEQTQLVLDGFRRHFCPEFIGMKIDKKSYAVLVALIQKYIS